MSLLSSRSLFRLRIVLPLLGSMFAFPPLALLIVSSPLGFGIVFPKAAWFFYYDSEGRSVCAMSFRRSISLLSVCQLLCFLPCGRSVLLHSALLTAVIRLILQLRKCKSCSAAVLPFLLLSSNSVFLR